MADLVLDYALLHQLAVSMRELKAKIKTDVDAGSRRAIVNKNGGTVDSGQVGNTAMYAALSAFFSACHSPFQNSMELLDKLSDTFDGIAKAFFDVDADFAGKVDTARLQAHISQWQADTAGYQHYLDIKDKAVTFQYYDENGHLQTGSIPLWSGPPPGEPGAMPTSIDGTATVGTNHTTVTTDAAGNITSETTTVNSGDGLTYTETTSYTYHDTNGDGKPDYVDYTSTITHSDGSSETVAKTTNPDGSYVVKDTTKDGTTTSTITPTPDGGTHDVTVDHDGKTTTTDIVVTGAGTGTKTVVGPDGTDTYTGNPDTGQWKLTKHEDPPPDYTDYSTVTI